MAFPLVGAARILVAADRAAPRLSHHGRLGL